MPLPSDEKLIQLATDFLRQFDTIFGLHPGFRPAHAKGVLLTGVFRPSPEAASLTLAPHVHRESTPVAVRFSNSTGLPTLPDNDSNADPRGMAIRFYLAERVHTDIISHAVDGFPTRTGQEFLEMLRAVAATQPSMPSPTPIEKFLASNPSALAFVQTPKPTPSSFARERYFGVNAFRFTNQGGVVRHGRYRMLPEAGVEHLDEATVKGLDADFLFEEIKHRVTTRPTRFQIKVQIAHETDTVDDATIHWPEERPQVQFGTLTLDGVAPENDDQQKRIIFDPIPRVEGIDPSDDPLLELRAALYLLSGRRRRQA